MTVNGEGRAPSTENIYHLGEKSGLKKKDVTLIINQTTQVIANWQKYAETTGVGETTIKTIHDKINLNLSAL